MLLFVCCCSCLHFVLFHRHRQLKRIREMEVRMQAAQQESTVPVKVASMSYSAVSTHAAPNVASETKQQDMLEMLKSYSQPAASSNVNKNLLLMNIVAGNEFERQKMHGNGK